jgi:hypothetical protein
MFDVSKKKKKKKKDKEEDGEAAESADSATTVVEEKPAAEDGGTGGGMGFGGEEPGDDMFSLDKKKKKKRPKDKDREGLAGEDKGSAGDGAQGEGGEANYTYEELLQRIQTLLADGDPSKTPSFSRVPIKMPQIALVRIGTKKTRWDNFPDMCKCMNRQPDHVYTFVLAELGTEGSIDGNNRLVGTEAGRCVLLNPSHRKLYPRLEGLIQETLPSQIDASNISPQRLSLSPLRVSLPLGAARQVHRQVHREPAAQVRGGVRGVPDVPLAQHHAVEGLGLAPLLRPLPVVRLLPLRGPHSHGLPRPDPRG